MRIILSTLTGMFIVLVCFLLPCEADGELPFSLTYPAAAPLSVDGRLFKDASGGVVLLRGVNATGDAKTPPFETLTDPTLLDPLPGWGINVIRLLFNWEAYEPEKRQYDESYLDYYQQVVWWAAERGIYVIVDFHQDAFSRFSIDGCGDGFPDWAVTPLVTPAPPINDETCEDWGTMMIFDLDHHLTWNQFHQNRNGVRTRFLDMLASVSHHLAGNPNIIGYDIINEPWGYRNELLKLFEDAAVTIRKNHPDAILFVSPHALVSGIGSNNMEKPSFSNFAYSPHYYDSTIYLTKSWIGTSPGNRLEELREKAVTWNVPMFLGEFGASETTGNGEGYMEGIYDWLDYRFISGAQWSYTPGWTPENKDGWNGEDFSIVDNTGQLRSMFMPRPYPKRTAGMPVEFLRGTNGFRYTWQNDPALGHTEFFLPSGYENGKTVQVTNGKGNCTISSRTMVCEISDTGLVEVRLSKQ